MQAQALILVAAFAVLLVLNVPIVFALGLSALLAIYSLGEAPAAMTVAQRMAAGIESFPLLAIPFFILAGNLMGRGGLARRLMDFANAVAGSFSGGLAYVNVLTCMMFGAISGSATAAVSSIGGFMIPEMNRAGYDRDFNVALTSTAATTGLLIPPSNVMIVYAVVVGDISVAALFLAGVLPGIVVGACLMVTSGVVSRAKGYRSGATRNLGRMARAGLNALPSLGLIVVVLGGILGGVFSATEAAAISVAYALILGAVVYRELRWAELPNLLLGSAKTTAIIMLLIGASQAVGWIMAYQQIPQAVSGAILALSDDKLVVLLLINLLLLVVGTFMDMTPAVLIFTPIFLPVIDKLGVDRVHFGMIMIANLCIGLCTPPVGTCLFVGCSVGQTTIVRVARAMVPFFLAMLVALALITYWPALSLWLPRVAGQM